MHHTRWGVAIALGAVIGSGCGVNVDKLLEGKQPPTDRVSLLAQTRELTIPQGAEQSVTITATRTPDYHGEVAFVAADVPRGVDAAFGAASTVGQVTTVTLMLHVSTSADVGSFAVRVLGKADPLPDATTSVLLTVTQEPAYVITPAAPALTVARGGVAPLPLAIARTNFTAPVALSLTAPAGFSAQFTPPGADTVTASVVVTQSVSPGTYPVTLRGVAPGLVDRNVPITVTVIDAVQLIAPQVSAAQNSSVAAKVIVNRGSYAGPIQLSAENLPAGVDATFDSLAPDGTVTMTITVSSSVAQGSYVVTLRGRGTGIADVTASFTLKVAPAALSVSLQPSSVTLLPGATATSTLVLARSGYAGDVAVTIDDAPNGITATPQPATVSGTTSTIALVASAGVAPGQYSLTVRATPAGLPVSAIRTATLAIHVGSAAPGTGNVVVTATTCVAPDWFASQDGTSPWTQVLPAAGEFRFTVKSATGGFAYHDSSGVTVRYMTLSELTAGPINLCPPSGSKTITGVGVHLTNNAGVPTGDENHYSLGGATATSSGFNPNFAIVGVRNGRQDLVVTGVSGASLLNRAVIRRDLDLPDGGSLGQVNLSPSGGESFLLAQSTLTVSGTFGQIPHEMRYLTTPDCVVNPMYTSLIGTTMLGVPDAVQRATDFHWVRAFDNSPTLQRSTTLVFHQFLSRIVTLPQTIPAPPVSAIAGVAKRLSAFVADIPTIYGDAITLQFSDAQRRTMTVLATAAYTGRSNVTIAMPDLSGVSGWPLSAQIPAAATVDWSLTFDGSSAKEPLCTEGHTTSQLKFLGTF